MDSTRQHKVGRLLQKEMSEIFEFETREMMQGGMVTITKVNVTKDLSIARFYLSIFAVKDKTQLLEGIRSHTSELRYRLGNRIGKQVRIIPQLEFFEDDSLDYIDNIDKLLKE
jgi:ribosome-binding factor A